MTTSNTTCFHLQHVVAQIAAAVGAAPARVQAAVELLESGNTLPFIARYRKEATGGLDETLLRQIEDALAKAHDLAARQSTVLKSIDQQGLLTAELRAQIEGCTSRQVLEDLYLPFKPKRRTRAAAAREAGLQPLADLLLQQEQLGRSRSAVLRDYVNPELGVNDEAAALQGALDIVAEQWAEGAELRSWMNEQAQGFGRIHSQVKRGKQAEAAKFENYFDRAEPVKRMASHRLLAMQRGAKEGLLRIRLELDEEYMLRKLAPRLAFNRQFEFHQDLIATVEDCYRRLLLPAAESAVMHALGERAEAEAIQVFAQNLRELLLAPPAGPRVTLGVDPGFRTGCKLAVVDATGKFLESGTVFPTPPRSDLEGAAKKVRELIVRQQVEMVAIGNGTASRETEAFVDDLLRSLAAERPDIPTPIKVLVSEAGASVYSASELATQEYPDLDVTVRGAISIAHRLQDPLAELVKIDPKSIGVGQYQHDVDQAELRRGLQREVESCVNSVGVDLNMASGALLSYVAGIGPKLAEKIVAHRDAAGRFAARKELLKVSKLGPKAFEQAAGFLRIGAGSEPLDRSAVHPESYYIVEKMAASLGVPASELVGNAALVGQLRGADFVDSQCGLPTVEDILSELAKPGRDPRREFQMATFAEGVRELKDLKTGMVLEGVVTNVTHFGAFIDVGVHQDGLIHVSELSHEYVHNPSDVIAVGDVCRVKVLEVDLQRKRIAVSRKQV